MTPKSGFHRYGVLKNSYLLLKGSIPGPRKRAVLLTQSIRPNSKITKEAPQISYVSTSQ